MKYLDQLRKDRRVESALYYDGGFSSEDGFGYEVALKPGYRDGHGSRTLIAVTVAEMRRKLSAVEAE